MIPVYKPLKNAVYPDWPAPDNIVALTSCRSGGYSEKPFDEFNLAQHVGDQVEKVDKNRQLLIDKCVGLNHIQWLNQIHGTDVVRAGKQSLLTADACYTSSEGIACAVLTADCLPLLICDNKGQEIAAVHAGWRGLVTGVIENTLAALNTENKHLLVWFGPAISQSEFEVGSEVREAFLKASDVSLRDKTNAAFLPSKAKAGHYFADLYQLARIRLQSQGVSQIFGGEFCSYQHFDKFYSYRRDNVTGRMASIIYRQAG